MTQLRREMLRGVFVVAIAVTVGCGRGSANMTELQRVASGTLDVVLLSPHDALRHGEDTFVIEFTSGSGRGLVDVGDVKATANMPMPGMPMFAQIDVRRTDVPGRYAAQGQFEMAGTWRLKIEWAGPRGKGSVTFARAVQ